MICGVLSSAAVSLYFINFNILADDIYQDILKRFTLFSPDELYGDADFILSKSWESAASTNVWFNDYGFIVLH